MEITKKDIWHMVKYVLDTDDESDIVSWTEALIKLKEIQKKYGHPTSNLIELDNEIFETNSMAIYPDKVYLSSNKHERFFKSKDVNPDIHILGDVTITECKAPIQVHGNVFCKELYINGDFKPSMFLNLGVVNITCHNLNCDDITVSGTLSIKANSVISSEIKATNLKIDGNIEKSSFLNADYLTVSGNVTSTFINNKNEDNIKDEIDRRFDPIGFEENKKLKDQNK